MKKLFLLLTLILIFSVFGCGKKSENQTIPGQNDADETPETADNEQNDADETAETADIEQNDDDDVQNDADNEQNINEDDNSSDDDEVLPDPCESNPCGDDIHMKCEPEDATNYRCRCENGYFSDGEKCVDLPECSPESATPCKDTTSGLIWSSKYYGNFENSMDYCMDLDEGGFDNWEIPTIKQLRSLIKNCPGTELSGECETEVDPNSSYGTPFNYSIENCSSCALDHTGKYSKFGDTETLWTISFPSNTLFNLLVDFTDAGIEEMDCPTFDTPLRCDAVYYHVRCVR